MATIWETYSFRTETYGGVIKEIEVLGYLLHTYSRSANNWWLRSPNSGNSNNVCNVNSNGNANNNNANNTNRFAP